MGETAIFRLPLLSTTARRGNAYGLNTSIPKPTLTATGKELPWVSISLPVAEVIGNGLSGAVAQASIALPTPVVDGLGQFVVQVALDLPLPQVTINAGERTAVTVPLLEVTATGKTSLIGRASVTLPALDIEGKSGVTCSLTLPLAAVTATGLAGLVANATAKIPVLELAATGDTPLIATASLSLPLLQVSGQGSKNLNATASISLPLVQITPNAYAGSLASASVTLPLLTVDADGFFHGSGSASITLPLLEVTANAPAVLVVLAYDDTTESITGYALVLNIENGALSDYSNYGFNSFCTFGGKKLGASTSGIYDLSGDTDSGTDIVSQIRTALQDGKTAMLKGVEDAVAGLTTDGMLDAKIVVDGGYSYAMKAFPPRESDAITTQRFKAGRGIASRYLALELTNRSGADFAVESAEMTVVPLNRRL